MKKVEELKVKIFADGAGQQITLQYSPKRYWVRTSRIKLFY